MAAVHVAVADTSRFGAYPADVGILAMEAYFPREFVSQSDLEKHDGVSAGKYTVGLGQSGMAFCTDLEDIYSVALSAVASLMEKYGVGYEQIGRLEVASETILDHSKAIKTVLMQLFAASGNTDVEGIDCMNACYAGTNALFNSAQWVESSAWDGRLALVVTADIAEYAAGPARPTGGAGAVVMLVGPGAPLVLERGCRASHMEHAYDFYKPNLSSPYPVVDGHFSQLCYLRSLDTCYARYAERFLRVNGRPFDLSQADFAVFHAPYNKLVQKSFGRAVFNEFRRDPSRADFEAVRQFASVAPEASYADAALEKAFVAASAASYEAKVAPGTLLPKQLGNLYTASLYAGLLSLVSARADTLAGARVLMFSYGSGLASSLFSLRVGQGEAARAALRRIRDAADLDRRLASRSQVAPEVLVAAMEVREGLHRLEGAFRPAADPARLAPGAFYLVHRDERGRREYARRPLS